MHHASTRLCTVLLILFGGLIGWPFLAAEEAPGSEKPASENAAGEIPGAEGGAREALERLLRSPLTSDRTSAVRKAVDGGERARPWARSWVRSDDPRLRTAGWSVLARIGDVADLVAARAALGDPQPSVSALAAEALVGLAGHLANDDQPWLPMEAVGTTPLRPLAFALVRRLEESVDKSLPACLFRLGEGAVPALVFIAHDARFSVGVRDAALEGLARIGGDAARAGLAALAGDADMVRRPAWWQALLEVGGGSGLRPVHDLVETWAAEALTRRSNWRQGRVRGPRGLTWRTRALFYHFIAACPPADADGHVAEFLRQRLFACARRTGRDTPTLVVAIVRSYLVMCDPGGEAIGNAVAATAVQEGRSSRRREELGEVLASLEVYREREGLQDAVRDLLTSKELPHTVEAWAHYLLLDTPAEDVRPLAIALLELEGDATTLAQRRLGARLFDRLGGAPVPVLTSFLDDADPWLRAWSTSRVLLLDAAAGAPSPETRQALLQRALVDRADRVFLIAVSSLGPQAGRAARERVLALYVGGRRSTRPLAARALRRWSQLAAPEQGEEAVSSSDGAPWVPPGPRAGLDARIRAAGAFRARMGD